jgi:hypothetical protein
MVDVGAQDRSRHGAILLDIPRLPTRWQHNFDVATDRTAVGGVRKRWICMVATRGLLSK